jgi:hypothetical protein
MTNVVTAHSTSIDGFLASADDGPEQPLGVGGATLHMAQTTVTPQAGTPPTLKMSAASASSEPSPSMRVRLCDGLAQRTVQALATDASPTVGLVAEAATVDLFHAPRTCLRSSLLLFVHGRASSWPCASCSWISRATLVASRLNSRPTRRPSEVVMGEFSTLCSIKNSAISSIGTKGRNVLGPGRMASATRRSASA